jgi:hypothetical protein
LPLLLLLLLYKLWKIRQFARLLLLLRRRSRRLPVEIPPVPWSPLIAPPTPIISPDVVDARLIIPVIVTVITIWLPEEVLVPKSVTPPLGLLLLLLLLCWLLLVPTALWSSLPARLVG